ncbi:TPA: hypothetical protein PO740_004846 [Escherichia coli]|nr:hypothetical protein [Escherichia coli]
MKIKETTINENKEITAIKVKGANAMHSLVIFSALQLLNQSPRNSVRNSRRK